MRTNSLQFKTLLIVAGAMAIAVAISVGALTKVYSSIGELDRVAREDFESQQAMLRAQAALQRQDVEWKNVLVRGWDAGALAKHWAAFEKQEKLTASLVREARSATAHEEVRAKLEAFLAAHKAAGAKYREALDAFKKAKFDPQTGDALGTDSEGASTLITEASTLAQDFGNTTVTTAVKSAETAYRVAIVATVLGVVFAVASLWIFMRRSVLRPIGAAVAYAERIAQGDLTADIRSRSDDEAGQLIASLARMNAALAAVVSQVRASAESVVAASGQVAAGTTDLSQRTEEQASSLEETAASMEELSSTVKQNADNAHKADELARGASKRAEKGGAEVVRVVVTMNEISQSAARIADIISVIDGIAFQTNILALNAAVEAARAGEQGRGFAVVAAEVRSLAQRSAQAAKEIKDLIGASVDKARAGTTLVEQAGDTIQALVIDVKQVSDLMGSIAEASTEQSRGVQQVNKTVTEMDKVVQQNAAAVQQSATAAEAMRRQAQALVQAVSAFRIEQSAAAAPILKGETRAAAPAPSTIDAPEPAKAPATLAPRKAAVAAAGPGEDWEEF